MDMQYNRLEKIASCPAVDTGASNNSAQQQHGESIKHEVEDEAGPPIPQPPPPSPHENTSENEWEWVALEASHPSSACRVGDLVEAIWAGNRRRQVLEYTCMPAPLLCHTAMRSDTDALPTLLLFALCCVVCVGLLLYGDVYLAI